LIADLKELEPSDTTATPAPQHVEHFVGSPTSSYPAHALAMACYIRAVPKPPPRLKIKRARVVVDDAGLKRLSVCQSCGEEKYVLEGETVCDKCKAHGGRIRLKRKRKAIS
jgi:hypothetical protein